jgi:hypothetical protein
MDLTRALHGSKLHLAGITQAEFDAEMRRLIKEIC